MAEESLTLKWGTLKGWRVVSPAATAALLKYADEPVSMGAMQQHDTPLQKQALCDLIDAIDGPITNDWSGETLSKDEAKTYILGYHAPKASA